MNNQPLSFSNVVSGTADKLSTLFSYLNLIQGYDNGSDTNPIYPRFSDDVTIDENYSYDCFLNSDVDIVCKWGANVGRGVLVFISRCWCLQYHPAFTTWQWDNKKGALRLMEL